ncbi:hypothetical protein ACTWQB_02570 [Piscibacillus sp. B03]|uniref:hypothetical protein n=1 Tax=Piscibacillus sp. B03 TaxID=3457430 RepID=UPI003FCD9EE1
MNRWFVTRYRRTLAVGTASANWGKKYAFPSGSSARAVPTGVAAYRSSHSHLYKKMRLNITFKTKKYTHSPSLVILKSTKTLEKKRGDMIDMV